MKVSFFTLQTYLKHHFPSAKGGEKVSESGAAQVEAVPVETTPVKPVASKPTLDPKKKLAVKKKLEGSGRKQVLA